jgi:hypothetical protein
MRGSPHDVTAIAVANGTLVKVVAAQAMAAPTPVV